MYFPIISTVFMKILFPAKATGNRNRCHVSMFTIIYALYQDLIKDWDKHNTAETVFLLKSFY